MAGRAGDLIAEAATVPEAKPGLPEPCVGSQEDREFSHIVTDALRWAVEKYEEVRGDDFYVRFALVVKERCKRVPHVGQGSSLIHCTIRLTRNKTTPTPMMINGKPWSWYAKS